MTETIIRMQNGMEGAVQLNNGKRTIISVEYEVPEKSTFGFTITEICPRNLNA